MRLMLVLVCVLGCLSCNRQRAHKLDLPPVMLWAWERPENLGFIDPRVAGVAVLEATAVIAANGSVQLRMRTQPLTLPTDAAVLAVVRIESPPVHAAIDAAQLLSGLLAIARLPGLRGIQIDFDARSSEREFYRTLLRSLAQHTSLPVSVTALASWCAGDRWLQDEPVVEVVPDVFPDGRRRVAGYAGEECCVPRVNRIVYR